VVETPNFPSSEEGPLSLGNLPRDVLYEIFSFLENGDLYTLSIVSKKLCMMCSADSLVFERRYKKAFPFDKMALWNNLVVPKYPFFKMRDSHLSIKEKTVIIEKFLKDEVDRNPKWDVETFEKFVGLCFFGLLCDCSNTS
jgi:F-box-like